MSYLVNFGGHSTSVSELYSSGLRFHIVYIHSVIVYVITGSTNVLVNFRGQDIPYTVNAYFKWF